jgi:hypothetical protein
MNEEDEAILRQFHDAEKKNARLVVECVRFYMYVPTAAAALAACVMVTHDNAKFDAARRQDLRFYLVEQVFQGTSDRWALRVLRRSANDMVDSDVREGRTFFEKLAKSMGGTYEGASPCYSEVCGLTIAGAGRAN